MPSKKNSAAIQQPEMRLVPLANLHPHPDNDYPVVQREMDDLKDSILRDGLAQLPLVRELPAGAPGAADAEGAADSAGAFPAYQIIAGHRRIECFRQLNAEGHPGFAQVPVNVLRDCSDARARILLDVTNLMTRQLTPIERAVRFERIRAAVPQMREADPALKGVRTAQVIAEIISRETGQAISSATVNRALAAGRQAAEVAELVKQYSDVLEDAWRKEFQMREGFTPAVVKEIASRDGSVQRDLFADYSREEMTPKQLAKLVERKAAKTDGDAERLLDTMIKEARRLHAMQRNDGVAIDLYRLSVLERSLAKLHRKGQE